MFGRRQRGQRSQEKVLGRSEHAERLALGREEEEALRLQEQLRRVEALGSAEREMDVKEISRLLEKEKLEEKVVEALEQEVFSEKQELLERKKSSEPLGAWEPLKRPRREAREQRAEQEAAAEELRQSCETARRGVELEAEAFRGDVAHSRYSHTQGCNMMGMMHDNHDWIYRILQYIV